MINLIDTSSLDNIAALLASACVSSTYEVESTRDIVNVWDNLRKNIKIKDDVEFIAAILTTGRIMHGNIEVKDPNQVMEIVDTFSTEIKRQVGDQMYTQKDFCAAFLSAACVSHSKKIVSAKDIVGLWEDIRKNIKISSDSEVIAAILTAGRIVDTRCRQEGFIVISDTFNNVTDEVEKRASEIDFGLKAISSAMMASAAIEITPKVEKIRDMVDAWISLSGQFKITNHEEYIGAILTAGRIKDLNAQHFMIPESMTDIHSKIVEYINKLE